MSVPQVMTECATHIFEFTAAVTKERTDSVLYIQSQGKRYGDSLRKYRERVDRDIVAFNAFLDVSNDDMPKKLLLHLSVCRDFMGKLYKDRILVDDLDPSEIFHIFDDYTYGIR